MFYLAKVRTYAWDAASQIALRHCSQEVREETGYIGVFSTKTRYLIFYVQEDARVWAH